MAWNEPGGGNRDPWGNRPDKGPPDLDEVFKNLQTKLGGIFSGRGGGGSGGSAGPSKLGSLGVGMLALVALVVWFASGFFVVQEAERGVVLRFGQYQDTRSAGLRWHLPWPIESRYIINVDLNRSVRLQNQSILTQDENIVEVDFAVQYNIKNAEDYLFQVRNADDSVEQVTESVLRQVVGNNNMDFVLQEGRGPIASDINLRLQEVLDAYKTGINITRVNLERAQPPDAVQAAFSDANKAREDKERFINEAEAFSNEIVPQARGDAKRALEEAKAYRTRVTKAAEGEASRFSELLAEYRKAPEVTRNRLYIDSVEAVLSNSSKVMLDTEGGNSLMYLPIDRLLSQGQSEQDSGNITRLEEYVDTPSPAAPSSNRRSREAP